MWSGDEEQGTKTVNLKLCCRLWQTSLFQQGPFSDVPSTKTFFFAWFLFIRPGLLGKGNDSSKTPSEESGTVSKSHRLPPGYWISFFCLFFCGAIPASLRVFKEQKSQPNLTRKHLWSNTMMLETHTWFPGAKQNLAQKKKSDLYWK